MNALATRKRLLIAESELNRTRLAEELVAVTTGARTVAERARSLGALASTAAVLVAGLAAFQRNRRAPGGGKPTRWRRLVGAAGLVSTLWLALRSQAPGSKAKVR